MRTHLLLLATFTLAQTASAAEVYTRTAAGACLAQDGSHSGASQPGMVNLDSGLALWFCSVDVGPALVHANAITSATMWVSDKSPTQGIIASLCFMAPGADAVCGATVHSSGMGNRIELTLPRPTGRFPAGTIAWISAFVPNNTSGQPYHHSGIEAYRIND